jgi:hypothetical protein
MRIITKEALEEPQCLENAVIVEVEFSGKADRDLSSLARVIGR